MEEEEELEKRINKALSFLREIETLDEQRVMNAWEAGKIFAEIKKQKSGTYWKWLKSASKRLSFSAVTASRYKKIADAFPTEAEIKEVASGGLTKVYKLAAEKMHEGNGTTSKKKEDESDAGDTSSEKENQLHRGLSSIRKTVTKFCKVTKEYPPEKWGASDIAQFLDAYDEMKKIAEKLEEHSPTTVVLKDMEIPQEEPTAGEETVSPDEENDLGTTPDELASHDEKAVDSDEVGSTTETPVTLAAPPQ